MSSLKTLDQQRAAFAWGKVNAVKSDLANYLPVVRNLPSMLLTNGLGQTLAFLSSQDGTKHKLYLHLQDWLCEKAPHPVYPCPAPVSQPGKNPGKDFRLIRKLTAGDSLTLRHATLEAQALAVWLKRFADALNEDKSRNEDKSPGVVHPKEEDASKDREIATGEE